jgi:hypothetical protein
MINIGNHLGKTGIFLRSETEIEPASDRNPIPESPEFDLTTLPLWQSAHSLYKETFHIP